VAGAWTADLVAGPTEPFAPLARLPLALAVTPRPRIAVVGKPIALGTLRTFSGLGARTTHSLTSAVAPGSDGVVELTAEGDFDSSRESATVVLEGVVLGSVGNLGTTCTAGTASFPVDRAALLEASKDGVFDLTVQNTLEVASSCTINRHRVTLRYDSADTASGVDFRDITLGTDRAIPLLVRNDGGAPLVVDAIGVSSTLCVALSEPLTLAPGASRDVFVRCTPVAAGPFEATLRAASNDPDRPLFEVSLFGVGVEPPRLVVEPAAVSADVPEGRTAERALEISNAGGRPLTVSAAAGAGFVQVAPPGVIVEPGGRVGLTVTLRAAGLAIGGHTAIINLTSNDPARALVEVPATITVLPDADRDGIVDGQDICPSRPDPDQADSDDDGHGDACDNCPATTNPGQEDDNADGSGDACQPIVIFTGLRQVAGERLVAEARARDPQVDQALSGEIRFEHVGVGQPGDPVPPPIVYVIESWRPGIWPIGGLVPGQAYRLVLSVTDGTTVPRAAEAQFVSQGERTLVIDMPPQPVIAAPATVECDRPLAGLARLDGRASSDPDTPTGGPDDIVEHEWFRRAEDGGLVPLGRGAVLDGAVIPLGVISVILRVTDSVGESAETDAVVVVRDTAAPSLRLSPEPAVLWPPDRTLRRVSLNPIAADLCDPSPAVILKGVTSSESAPAGSSGEPGAGAGVADASGTACDVVELEAARSPTGPGRTYVVTCEARDRSGSGVSATATIVVPRNLGGARR
jgi:hypothetical protein